MLYGVEVRCEALSHFATLLSQIVPKEGWRPRTRASRVFPFPRVWASGEDAVGQRGRVRYGNGCQMTEHVMHSVAKCSDPKDFGASPKAKDPPHL